LRLGAPISKDLYQDPESWIVALRAAGYRAAYCPVGLDADDATIAAYAQAAEVADIVIAEVGAWSNPLSPDPDIRAAAIKKCQDSLALAEKIGARCCVNIAGSRGEKWDGPHPDDLTQETFDIIVETVREIIDAVQLVRSFYALETMPWMYPDSPESYLRLMQAIDRPALAAHLDPVNLVNSPPRYFENTALLEACFDQLGPYIKSVHAKDVLMEPDFIVHLNEVRPGLGTLDYATFLSLAHDTDPDMPVMLEHLPNAEEYRLAADYVRSVAEQHNIPL